MKILPKLKIENIIEQSLNKEILLYDVGRHQAFSLNETLTIVYRACDGKTRFRDLQQKHNFPEEVILLAIDELERANLIEKTDEYVSPFANLNRREVIKKIGYASLVALPVIATLVAATASMAASAVCPTPLARCACNLGTQPGASCGRGESILNDEGQITPPCPQNCTCTVTIGCGTLGCGGVCS